VFQGDRFTLRKKILKPKADPKIFQRQCTFGSIVNLTHWSNVIEFRWASAHEGTDMVEMDGFVVGNGMPRSEAPAPMSF
jgi:hypothetical protein